MKRIEAIIKPSMLEDVKKRVREVGVKAMTLSEVTDCGGTVGRQMIYRTTCIVDSVTRVRIQTTVDEDVLAKPTTGRSPSTPWLRQFTSSLAQAPSKRLAISITTTPGSPEAKRDWQGLERSRFSHSAAMPPLRVDR